jgi:hypothetical protein
MGYYLWKTLPILLLPYRGNPPASTTKAQKKNAPYNRGVLVHPCHSEGEYDLNLALSKPSHIPEQTFVPKTH